MLSIKRKLKYLAIAGFLTLSSCYNPWMAAFFNDELRQDRPNLVSDPITITITIAAIRGVTIPVAGVTPASSITTAQYNGTVAWSPTVSGTFAAGTDYTATINLTAKPGYTLEGVTPNFFTVAGANPVINAADSGVVTAKFPGAYNPQDLANSINTKLSDGDITATASGGVVTVTGGGKPPNGEYLGLDIPSGVTVRWEATLGQPGSGYTEALVRLSGSGTLEINGDINATTWGGIVIYGSPNLIISGGSVECLASAIAIKAGASPSIVISGGSLHSGAGNVSVISFENGSSGTITVSGGDIGGGNTHISGLATVTGYYAPHTRYMFDVGWTEGVNLFPIP
jgi:hypothetical protein